MIERSDGRVGNHKIKQFCIMGTQKFVSLIFTRENAERFQCIRDEMSLDENGLLEFFFKLYDKNKLELKNNFLECIDPCEKVTVQIENLNESCHEVKDEASINHDQYSNEPVTLVQPNWDLSATGSQARLVDQESGETAEVLISLQHYQADDRAMSGSVSNESHSQECKRTTISNGSDDDDGDDDGGGDGSGGGQDDASTAADSLKEETAKEELAKEELAKEQLLDSSIEDKIATIFEQPADVDPVCNSLSSPVLNSEKNIDVAEKVDNSVQPNGEENILEEFVVESSECKEQDTNGTKKSDIKSDLPEESEPKRKRRNDVWLSRIQDADFEERHYKCSYCSAAFFHPHHLQRHEKQLHKLGKEVKPNQCKDCFKTFATMLTLKFHQDFACRMVRRPHRCSLCQLGFKSSEEVRDHKCSSNPSKPLCCLQCDYRTGSPRDLEHHLRIHTGERCYKCDLCDFRTAWKKNLKEHVLKHSGLKPFICQVCNFATNDKSNLRSHLAKHSENRPNLCHTCGSSFREARSLKSHMLSHSDAKAYKCSSCDCSTRYKSSLKSHMRSHHGAGAEKEIVNYSTDNSGNIENKLQEVNEIYVETMDITNENFDEKQYYMCQECSYVIDDKAIFDSHTCFSSPLSQTATSLLDGGMVIQIIENTSDLSPVLQKQ
ncbi:zinc finger protein 28 isoform X2 [Octopus bimaculoides]|uniref:zinc finger protein 28 isoform X2 n=1 Tax=Octopus bimaculoides TaxID=37653 RepID=UPI0022E6F0B2|nr:zinc finger protein 28 isoform X2 [Octopus bimaculoides]